MSIHPTGSINLQAVAHQEMIRAGFEPDLSPAVQEELKQLEPHAPDQAGARDLRSLAWSSIDNNDSRDLDQIEYAEALQDGTWRVLVGVADVDSLVPRGSAIDEHAAANTTSIYLGVVTYPMLPLLLSTDLTSLLDGQDRLAVVIDMVVGEDGEVKQEEVYRALVRNHAKLTYDGVGAWLENRGPLPAAAAGLEDQLRLQDSLSEKLLEERQRRGTLDFETIEARPVMAGQEVVDLEVPAKNRARYLIENFMVAANGAMARFLADRGLSALQRVVRTPERWDRIVELAASLGSPLPAHPDSRALAAFLTDRRQKDPDHFPDLSLSIVKLLGHGEYAVVRGSAEAEGHFGLAVQNYTHSTAPNRRYPDLVMQRLVKASLAGAPPPYGSEELEAVAEHCTERERAAQKVERQMRKVAAAVLFAHYVGREFDAIVTGASSKGTFVRTLHPPVEGMVVRGERGMDVGDRVRVRLSSTDPARGFVDFERA